MSEYPAKEGLTKCHSVWYTQDRQNACSIDGETEGKKVIDKEITMDELVEVVLQTNTDVLRLVLDMWDEAQTTREH